MVNKEIINERLREIEENLKILEELKAIDENKFCSDPKIFKLAERCLELSIQALLDICHHIISANDWPRPESNYQAIEIIAEGKVIPQEFAKKIAPMAGLRNILIHEYIKVDPAIIYQHIQNLGDFYQFEKHIVKYLSKIND